MTLNTIEQVSEPYKNRVLEIFRDGITPFAVRVASTGLGFENFKTLNPQLELDTIYGKFANSEKLSEFLEANRKHFVTLALNLYLHDLVDKFSDALFEEKPVSEQSSLPKCYVCGGSHE